MDFVDLTYCVRLNPFCNLSAPIKRVTLVTHLCSYFMFFCQIGKKSRLIHRVGKWFLCITMFALSDVVRSLACVGMISSCIPHSIHIYLPFNKTYTTIYL